MKKCLRIGITNQSKRNISSSKFMTRVVLCAFILILVSCTSIINSNYPPSGSFPLETISSTPYIVPTATETIPLTQKLIATETPYTPLAPSFTFTPQLSSSISIPTLSESGRVAVIIQASVSDKGIITDLLDDHFLLINRFTTDFIGLDAFSNDGCHIIGIKYTDGSFTIYTLDLRGNLIEQKKAFVEDAGNYHSIYQYTLSPSGDWIAYKIVDQIQMSIQGAAIQNVRLLRVNEMTPQKAEQLTERGGARPAELTWSPDGRFLAYTDFDEAGTMQIFIFDPEKNQKYQVSHFIEEVGDSEIQDLRWSPNSQAIAFTSISFRDYEYEGDLLRERLNNGKLGIISIPEYELRWLKLNENFLLTESSLSNLRRLFWSQDLHTLLFQLEIDTGEHHTDGFGWYDLEKDEVVHLLQASDLSAGAAFVFAFPLHDLDYIGIWGDKVYLYNQKTEESTILEPKYFLTEGVTFLNAPNGPIEIEKCSK